MRRRQISRSTAENIVQLADDTKALIKQEEFNNFYRTLILTPDGIIAIRSPLEESNDECEISEFHGLDRDLNDIRSKFLQIKVKGFFD